MRAARRLALLTLLAAALPAGAADFAPLLQERPGRFRPVRSSGGMVAGQEPRAAAVGAAMLAAGGNAVDAAVAASFAEAVTLPAAGNLGGGGFLLLWLPGPSPALGRGCLASGPRGATSPELAIGGGQAVAIDFRESAPAAATADQFLRPDGTVDRQRATRSPLSAGVPGSVAGLVLAQRCYGRLPLAQVIAPAIALAEQGLTVDPFLAESLADAAPLLAADPGGQALLPARRGRRHATRPGGRRDPAPAGAGRQPAPHRPLRPPGLLRRAHRRCARGPDARTRRPDHRRRPGGLPRPARCGRCRSPSATIRCWRPPCPPAASACCRC
jgi:Gamma-glutamyltransferase